MPLFNFKYIHNNFFIKLLRDISFFGHSRFRTLSQLIQLGERLWSAELPIEDIELRISSAELQIGDLEIRIWMAAIWI